MDDNRIIQLISKNDTTNFDSLFQRYVLRDRLKTDSHDRHISNSQKE